MNSVLLQAAAQGGASSWMNIGMIVLIFVIFYFFMIRPQSKRQKEIRKFQDTLGNGKKVITQGGIYGTIREVKEDYVVVEIADGVKIRVSKGMVFASPEDAAQQPDGRKENRHYSMSWWQKIKRVVISREVATFCGFLVVASLMWLMYTIGTQREMTIPAPVVYYGIPDDVKLAKPLPTEVLFTIEEDGSQLLNYLFTTLDTIDIDLTEQFSGKRSLKEIKINYLPYVEEKMNVISTSCNIVNVEPAIYTSTYTKVYTRRVPVRLRYGINTALQYTLLDSARVEPKEVLIRGTHSAIDTVRAIYVDSVREVFRKSKVVYAHLVRPEGVELLTSSVKLHIDVERQTEKSFTLPIEMANVPDNVNIHLFPKDAQVIFSVGLSRYNNLRDVDYRVVFDYDDVDSVRHTSRLKLINEGNERNIPYRIVPSEVEYLIEKL